MLNHPKSSVKPYSFYPPGEDPRLPQNIAKAEAERTKELEKAVKMHGITLAAVNSPFEKSDQIAKPTPGKGQVLVKSLWTGLNPVEPFMQQTGMMVVSWPIVLGCETSGKVVEVGEGVTKFKVGDYVYGCTRLGVPGYSTLQEFFLMDDHLTFLNEGKLTLQEAATIGVGALTASLGLIAGLGLKFPEAGESPVKDEWIIILGGSGAVGQFAIQIAKLCGYKVLASCSPANDEVVKAAGASATLNYKLPLDEQLKTVTSVTSNNFHLLLDASAFSTNEAIHMLALSASKAKIFATTNDWSLFEDPEDTTVHRIKLGEIGRESEGNAQKATNAHLSAYIPILQKLCQEGILKPMEYVAIDKGWDGVFEGLELLGKTGGKKVIVKIADE